MKHNKKRNTAFLYECLIKEMTKAVVRGELQKKQQIVETLKRYFSKGKPLYNDLQLYKQLMEPQKLEESLGLRYMQEVKGDWEALDRKESNMFQQYLNNIKKETDMVNIKCILISILFACVIIIAVCYPLALDFIAAQDSVFMAN